MSEVKLGRQVRRSSNSSMSSRASNVSFSEKVRRESTAKFDNFMKECRAAYLTVLSSTTEKITSIDELILGENCFLFEHLTFLNCWRMFKLNCCWLLPSLLAEHSGCTGRKGHHHHQSLFIREIVSFYMVFLGVVFKTRLKYSKELLTIMLKIQKLTL